MFSTLQPDQPHIAAGELTLPPATSIPERKYVGLAGPATFMSVFDCRESGGVGGEEYMSAKVLVGGKETEVLRRGMEKFISG
jgi:hypothetical protein